MSVSVSQALPLVSIEHLCCIGKEAAFRELGPRKCLQQELLLEGHYLRHKAMSHLKLASVGVETALERDKLNYLQFVTCNL